jgi:hypothetical protein
MSIGAFNLVYINGTAIGGVSSPDYDRREEQKVLGHDGQPLQTGSSVANAFPKASFSTVAARAMLGIVSLSAILPWVVLNGSTGMQMYGLIPNTSGPGYASATLLQAALGEVYLKGLSWSIGEVVKVEVEAFFLAASPGSSDPVVQSGVSTPTLPVNFEQLALASIVFGSTTMLNPTSLTLAITHKAENNAKDMCCNAGQPFPIVSIKAGVGGQGEILLDVETADLTTVYSGTVVATFDTLNSLGVGLGTTGLTMTMASTITRVQNIKGADGNVAKRSIQVRATWNGTTNPLTFAQF